MEEKYFWNRLERNFTVYCGKVVMRERLQWYHKTGLQSPVTLLHCLVYHIVFLLGKTVTKLQRRQTTKQILSLIFLCGFRIAFAEIK